MFNIAFGALIVVCCCIAVMVFILYTREELGLRDILVSSLILGVPAGLVVINSAGLVTGSAVAGITLIALSLLAHFTSFNSANTRTLAASSTALISALVATTII